MQHLITNIFETLCKQDILNIIVTDTAAEVQTADPENVTIIYSENLGASKGYHFYDYGEEHIKYNSDAFTVEDGKEYLAATIRFALIKGTTVYLLFEVSEKGQRFLESVLKALLPELIEKAIEKRKHNFKVAYARAIDTKVKQYKEDIEQNVYDAERKEQELIALHQKIVMDKVSLQSIDNTAGKWKQKADSEFCSLMKLIPNLYKAIYLYEDELIALTYEVEINYNYSLYEIGEFEIRINFSTGVVKIHNMTRRLDDVYDHPHIMEGAACLGNISKGITKMLAEFEFFGVLQLIHTYLHTYNSASPHHKIEYWDPDYVDEVEDQYESCRQQSSGYTCVECGDFDCPFFQYAYDECFENSSLDDCINCEYQCHLGRDRIKEHKKEQQQEREITNV